MGFETLHDLGAETWNIDGTASWESKQHIADLLSHIGGHIFLGFLCGSPEVRRQHQPALDCTQWRVLVQRFRGEDIQTCTGNHTVINGFGDGSLINNASPSTVHDPGRRFH